MLSCGWRHGTIATNLKNLYSNTAPVQDTGISWMKNRSKVHQFKTSIIQLKTLLEPLARAVKCLESSRSTLADVYLFWLAVTATYTNLFKKNSEETGINLPDEVVHDVRRIVNGRYKEMIEDPSKQVYLATFFLHPCKSSLPLQSVVNLHRILAPDLPRVCSLQYPNSNQPESVV